VILENDVPQPYQPVAIADETVPLRANHPVTLVGLGVTRTRRNNVMIGVTSAGVEIFQNCLGMDNLYTDARAHKKWVQSTLASYGIELSDGMSER